MYNLASALVYQGGTWQQIEAGDVVLKTLHQENSDIRLNVTESISGTELHFRMKESPFINKTLYSKLTVNEWLAANGDNVLPGLAGFKSLDKIVRHHYLDSATDIGSLRGEPTIIGFDYSVSRPYYKAVDMNLANKPEAYRQGIATCAGLAHLTKQTATGSCVINGSDTIHRAKEMSYGFHDFSEFGEVKQFALTNEMISESDNGLLLNLGEDLKDKLVILSIQGSLFFETIDNSPFTKVGTQSIALNKHKVPWLQLIFQTQRWLDVSNLELLRIPNGDSSVSVEQLSDSDMHKAMLKGTNSFAVIITPFTVDEPIALESQHLFDAGLRTGIYNAGDWSPAGIMLNNYNQPVNYINKLADDTYLTKANRYKLTNYVFETTNWKELLNIDDSLLLSGFLDQVSIMRNFSFYQLA